MNVRTWKERAVYGIKLAANVGALYLIGLLTESSVEQSQILSVVPLIIAAGISAGAGIGQGILASQQSRKLSDKARRLLERVKSPTMDELMLELEDYVLQGELEIEDAETIMQAGTELEDVQASPEFRAYQTDALSRLSQTVEDEGMDAQARASLNQATNSALNFARGRTESTLANRRARGIGGSGDELAALLQGDQAAAGTLANLGYEAAAGADARKMQALQSLMSGAGQMEERDFNQQARKAEAADIIANYNAGNLQNQINRNVTTHNAANAANLGERQRIADSNTGLRNEEERGRVQARKDVFNADLAKAGGQAQALQAQAGQTQQQGQAMQNAFGQMGTALANQQAQNDRDKMFEELLKSR